MRLIALRDLDHGDWKTALVNPGRWPTIPKGTIVLFVKEFTNLYGRHFTVKGPNSQMYDVPSAHVKEVDDD